MKQGKCVVLCLSIFLGGMLAVVSSPAFAQRVMPSISVEYGPSSLTWTAGFSHQGARLTIAGPAGVWLTRSFGPGESFTFGLVDETGQPLPDGAYSFELHVRRTLSAEEREVEAAGQQGGWLSENEAQQLRAGFERANGPFVARTSGSFTIQGGQIGEVSAQERSRAAGGAGEGSIRNIAGANVVDAGDIMAGSGLAAGSTAADPDFSELELVFGAAGDRGAVQRFSSFMEISSLDGFNDMTVAVSTGYVGIGTTTPASELHVRGVGDTQAEIFLEETVAGNWYRLSQGSDGLWFNSSAAPGVLKLKNAAPGNSIVVDPSGLVGLGTSTPGGKLHIFGGASSDVFSAIGPDPSPSGTALNFGYAGATFGIGAGFFNVRPAAGSVAPNPAIYFATNNIDRMMIDNQGFLGVHLDGLLGPGFNPAHPIHAQISGAFLSAGGLWTNASSRDLKQDVKPLSLDSAVSALRRLEPVSYTYRVEPDDPHVGFIAEDVPDLVATPDRKTLASMDIVAVLTRVVQEQQKTIEALQERLDRLEGEKSQ